MISVIPADLTLNQVVRGAQDLSFSYTASIKVEEAVVPLSGVIYSVSFLPHSYSAAHLFTPGTCIAISMKSCLVIATPKVLT